jgi:hypothetical protein
LSAANGPERGACFTLTIPAPPVDPFLADPATDASESAAPSLEVAGENSARDR